MIDIKPSESPPYIRYVIRNAGGFYYDGHGSSNEPSVASGKAEAGVPAFRTTDIMFAAKYGDVQGITDLIKTHKKWCIDRDRQDLFALFDTCEVLETYT